MAMDQQAPEAMPAEAGAGEGGGASKLVADTHSGLMKLSDLVGAKFPEDGEKLNAIIQQFQSFVDGLGQAPGQAPPQGAPGMVSPEAGVAKASPVV